MFSEIGGFVASRLAGGAIDAVERRIIWIAIGGMFLLAAILFLLTAVFVVIERATGPMTAAGILGGSCLVIGVGGFFMPRMLQWFEQFSEQDETIVSEFAETVDTEVEEAADYFGAMEVAISAFMLGFSTAQQMKRARTGIGTRSER